MKIHNIVEGYKVLPPISPIDKEKYQPRSGLEGPFRLRNGKVVYYDPQEGSYYDPDTDMYISYDDYKKMDEQGAAEGQAMANKNQAKAKKAGADLKMDPDTGTPDHFTAAQRRKRGLPEGYYSVRSNSLKQELENNGWERIPAREVPDNAKYGYRKNGVGRFYKVIDEPYHSFDASFVKPRRVNALIPLDTLLQLIRGSSVTESDKRPKYVVTTKDKPKIVKPSMGGESPHPYQGKLVGATESSQWGEPKDVLAQVLQTLEREVEWPLTDVMDPQQVKQLLSPLMQAVSQALNSLDEASVATMRKYFAGDEKAEDPSKTSAMRDFFSNFNNENPIKPSSGPVFRSKEAEVSNSDYEWTHGKKPSGQGSWFFVAHRGGVNFSKDVEGEDYIQLNQMSYTDAKKAAVKWAKSKGHTSLFVAT